MGNRLVCCRLTWTSFTNSEDDITSDTAYQSRFQFTNHVAFYPPAVMSVQPSVVPHDASFDQLPHCQKAARPSTLETSVQHISEREPEDLDFNPSLNASNTTLFLHSILQSIKQSSSLQKMLRLANREKAKHSKKTIQRWSSCGSVYIVCLLIKPERMRIHNDLKSIYSSDHDPLIKFRSDQSPSLTSTYGLGSECSITAEVYREVYEIYDERVYPLFPMSSYCQIDSNFVADDFPCTGLRFQHQILYFLNRLFSSSLLTAESAIVALVYLERLISSLEMYVVSWSWRRQLLACVLIASKVLDDQAVWNADYCQLLKDVHVDDLNDLERHTLSLLQFNTGVPPAVYARYYFDLLTLGEAVALNVTAGGQRRRMTPRLARHLRVLPVSAEARAEHFSAASSSALVGGALNSGGGGILFDLPCSSLVDASSDASTSRNRNSGNHNRQYRSRRRPHSASHLPFLTRSSTTTHAKAYHRYLSKTANESEYERSTSAASAPASPSTCSSSSLLTWKFLSSVSSSSLTFSAASSCVELSTAASNANFDPWPMPTDTCHLGSSKGDVGGRGNDATTNNALFLLQQDSGLY